MWTWVLSLALGGPIDVAAERGWLLVENGETEAARQAMQELIPKSPDAQLVSVYLDASATMGLGPQAVAETRGLSVEAPWEDMAEPLAGLVQDQRTLKQAHALATKLRDTYPDRPDLLAPIWQDGGGGKLGRLRTSVFGSIPDSPQGKARQLKLRQLVRIDDAPTRVVVEQAFEMDAFGPYAIDVELHDHARALAEKGLAVSDLDIRPEELRRAVERAHPMFLLAGNPKGAEVAWSQLGVDDAGAWGYRAEARRLAKDLDGAAQAVEAGYRALGRPTDDDVTVADLTGLATHAAYLLERASEVDLARELGGAAWAQSVAATALTGELRGATPGPAGATSRAQSYPGRDKTASALSKAAEATDPAERWLHVTAAWASVTTGAARLEDVARTPDLYLDVIGDVWLRAADVFADADDLELAVTFGTLALTAGVVDGALHGKLASWHAKLDGDVEHSYAAFHHAAIGRGLGADRATMEALIQEHHEGLGEAIEVATAVGGEPPPPEAVAAKKRRSVRVRGSTSKPKKGGAVLGEKAPSFAVETAYGTFSRSSLSGRVVIMTFFVSDYAPCIEQLKDSGQLAKRLRAQGIDVVHIGISRDADRGRFDDLHRVGQRWGQLAWAPEVATAFGVERQPTTWILDRNGNARYFVDHRILGSDLEAQVRAVSIE